MILHDPANNGEQLDPKRVGIPTASAASRLITSKGELSTSLEKYAYELAQARDKGRSVKKWHGNKYTKLGHEREPVARAWYELETGYDTLVPGFITPNSLEYGCTPDLLVYHDAPDEIDQDFIGISQLKNCEEQHGKYLAYVAKNNRAPTEHYAQCQFEMIVTGAQFNDLAYYHPILDPFIIRVHKDAGFCRKLREAIKLCCEARDKFIIDIRNNVKTVHENYYKEIA